MTADNYSSLSKTKLTISPTASFAWKEQQVGNMSNMTYCQTQMFTLQLLTYIWIREKRKL